MVQIEDLAPVLEMMHDYVPAPLRDLMEDEFVREKIDETARQFFQNGNITVNLIPAILLGLGLLALKALLGIPLLGLLGGGGGTATGYGVSTGYGAPAGGYGAPSDSYGTPDTGYGAPAPDSGYGAGRRRRAASISEEQRALYTDVIAPNMETAKVPDYVLSNAVEHQAVIPQTHPLLN